MSWTKGFSAVVLALASGIGLTATARAECGGIDTAVPLLCRGQLTLVAVREPLPNLGVESRIDGLFYKIPWRAGSYGEYLKPSSCAFAESAVPPTGPSRFRLSNAISRTAANDALAFQTINTIIVQCAGNPNCVTLLCVIVENPFDNALRVAPDFVNTIYPVFKKPPKVLTEPK